MSAQGRRSRRTVERERVAWPAAEANCNGSNGGGGDIGKRGSDNNRDNASTDDGDASNRKALIKEN